MSYGDGLPETGFVRLKVILAPRGPIPISKSTWWAGVKNGRFPKPVKLGPRTTAWRVEDIRRLIDEGVACEMGRWCAETIAEGLEGRRQGANWIACCPAHKDDTPSLSIDDGDDGKPVVHCFAGCSQAAVIDALKDRGLWPSREHSQSSSRPSRQRTLPHGQNAIDKRRIATALKPWCAARPKIAEIINASERFAPGSEVGSDDGKPRLLFEPNSPDRSVERLRDMLTQRGDLYDRGTPARLVRDQLDGRLVARPLTPETAILEAHRFCRPYKLRGFGDSVEEADIRLPRWAGVTYLDWQGEWKLPPLNGITSTPLLRDDGTIRCLSGYDQEAGLYLDGVPDVSDLVPERPTRDDAVRAFNLLRQTFATFCFADAATHRDPSTGEVRVDLGNPPGRDESAFLVGLMTAVCRNSLVLAPGLLVVGANLSGSGTGKGLLVRCICIIAHGREPHAVTAGETKQEFEKRIAAELIAGDPVLLLDNLNSRTLKSDLLASAMTERSARVRILGKSEMASINTCTFVALTGNALSVSEDLARRFLTVELDARIEDPETRQFSTNIRDEVARGRADLLAAALTMWRWGRLQSDLPSGQPLGGYEMWCRWVRDPLLALGCKDPVLRISETKQRDLGRQSAAALLESWWRRHEDTSVRASELHAEVTGLIDPHDRGRQFVAAELQRLANTRIAGFRLTRHQPTGKWSVATYKLVRVDG